MRCLVTGAAGFIGSHVVAGLRAAGHAVIGLDRALAADPSVWRIDLAEEEAGTVADLCAGVDAVIHLAARPGVRDAVPEEARWRDNVVATQRLFEAVPLQTPMVVASSSSVYGGAERRGGRLRPSREEDRLRPRGAYARTKVAAEQLCAERRRAGGPVTVVRPFTVAGEGQRPDMALSRFIDAVRTGAPIRLLGGPDRVRDVTDVADVTRGILRVLETGFVGTVNLGTGVGHRLVDLVEAVTRAVGQPARVVVEPAADEEVEATLADTTRCADALGFVPRTDLDELVARQVTATSPLAVSGGRSG